MGIRKGDETNIPFLPIPKDSANRIYTDYFSASLQQQKRSAYGIAITLFSADVITQNPGNRNN